MYITFGIARQENKRNCLQSQEPGEVRFIKLTTTQDFLYQLGKSKRTTLKKKNNYFLFITTLNKPKIAFIVICSSSQHSTLEQGVLSNHKEGWHIFRCFDQKFSWQWDL